jgi:uroporphyrinogen-III synthase
MVMGEGENERDGSALLGKRIVITRAAHQAGDFAALLECRGAIPLLYPCLSIAPVEDTALLDQALNRWAIGGYDWVVFTSVNAVEIAAQHVGAHLRVRPLSGQTFSGQIFSGQTHRSAPTPTLDDGERIAPNSRLQGRGMAYHALCDQGVRGASLAAVGAATAHAVERWFGVSAACIPDNYHAGALAETLPVSPGDRILILQAEIAAPTLSDRLSERGAQVDRVAVYRTVMGGDGGVDLPALLARDEIDAVTFASPSAVQGFLQRMGSPRPPPVIACIGETTAQTARDAGFTVAVVPPSATIEHLVNSLENYFATR